MLKEDKKYNKFPRALYGENSHDFNEKNFSNILKRIQQERYQNV